MAERPRDRFRTLQTELPGVTQWPVPQRVGPPELPDAASAAHDALAGAAQPTPCAGRHEWTSEVEVERREAARLCIDCPMWVPCSAAGADEGWGVWAGVDRAGPEAVAQRRRRGLTAA